MLKSPNKNPKPAVTQSLKMFTSKGRTLLFKQRGKEITRIETLSDAVFAFSISLLIMSLEVPQTFIELKHILKSFFPFVATVSLVFLFWYHQNRFFRHYGINDIRVIVLNAMLLIMVLFYVYPLKFLFSLLFSMVTHIDYFSEATTQGKVVVTQSEFPQLVIIYSVGYAAIWLIFYLMYTHAWKRRQALALTKYEVQDTLKQLRGALLNVIIGIAGSLFAWANLPEAGGICFLLIPPMLWLNNWYYIKQLKKEAVL